MGAGMNPARWDHSFPFIKCLVLGDNSEHRNHNCKQKWRRAWSPHYTSPSFKLAEGPSSQHGTRGEAGHQTPSWTHREPGLERSGWRPLGLTATTPQGSARSAVCSPDWSHARANKGHTRRGQTSVPGV